jgi:hypothetical protein
MSDITSTVASSVDKDDLLYQLLKKEHGYYKTILEISLEENRKLKSHEPLPELKPLIKKKKVLLGSIGEIDAAMAPLKKYWQAKANRTDEPAERIKLELSELNNLLKQILQLDLANQKTMESHMAILRERNQTVSNDDSNLKSTKLSKGKT